MINIAKPLTDYVIYCGKKYKLNISFDVVLKMYEVFKDDFLTDSEKAQFALALLVRGKKMPEITALDVIFREQIDTHKQGKNNSSMKVVDFIQDSGYIYSSFLMDYGIDLIDYQGKLHWQKFIALFQGLSEHTKIREVMSIRARPLPAPNKHNQEYIKNLIELKSHYALEISQKEREQNFQTGLKKLAQTLIAQAEMR